MMLAYVDSSVWIARFEGLLPYRQKIDNQLMQLAEQGISFCVSDVVLLGVLIKPIQVSKYESNRNLSPCFPSNSISFHL